jgi:hypothetical protein
VPATGAYMFPISQYEAGTSNTAGNGTLRLSPFVLTRSMSFDRIGIGVTGAGEAGSKFRLGVYADNGNAYPGALLLDAGQIAGDSATDQELTITLTLAAGVYWTGGAVQSAPSSQPTIRVHGSDWNPPILLPAVAVTSSVAVLGFQQLSVTGALPSTFTVTPAVSGTAPRPSFRVA